MQVSHAMVGQSSTVPISNLWTMFTFSKNGVGVQHNWSCELITRGGAQKGKFVHSKNSTTSVLALSTSSPYIYEHNRGGAWSLSTSSPTFMNTTEEVLQVSHVQTQKLKTSPSTINAEHLLLWFGFIFTTEVLEFFYWIGLPFWAPPLVNYVHKIRGVQQKSSNRGWWNFFWPPLLCS